MQKRVVITGMGIYSCLGRTLDEVRDALYNGKSGIVYDPVRKEMGFRSAFPSTEVSIHSLRLRGSYLCLRSSSFSKSEMEHPVASSSTSR